MTRSRVTAKRKPSRAGEQAKQGKNQKKFKQLVVTLTVSGGEIEKIEELVSSGKRRAYSEAEFAALAGDDSLQDACEALEAAYMAGVQDGLDDAQYEDLPAGAPREQKAEEESFGEKVLRAGLRKIVFRRAVHRKLERLGGQWPDNGAHSAR
jgi:hypothetical protein